MSNPGRGRGRSRAIKSDVPPAPGRDVSISELPRSTVSSLPAPGSSQTATELRRVGRGKSKTKTEVQENKEEQETPHEPIQQKELVVRPGYGKAGRVVRLFANWFPVELDLDKVKKLSVQQYSVNIEYTGPDVFRLYRKSKNNIFWEMVRSNRDIFTWDRIVYDDDAVAFTLERLEFPHSSTTHNFNVEVQLFGESGRRRFTVEMNLVNTDLRVDLSQLGQGYEQKDRLPLQCIDVVLTQSRRCTLVEYAKDWYGLSRSFFKIPPRPDPLEDIEINYSDFAIDLGFGKELWKGVFISANVGQNYKPYVVLDVKHRVFYKDMKCPELVWALLGANYFQLDAHQVYLIKKELKSIKFITKHSGGKRRLKCQDIGPPSSSTHLNDIFPYDVNGEVRRGTVQQYFKDIYGIDLLYPDLPTLIAGTKQAKKQRRVPMELCWLERPQSCNPAFISDTIRSKMVQATSDPPAQRKKKTEDLLNETVEKDPFAKAFGLQVRNKMIELDGRVLDKPDIMQDTKVRLDGKGAWRLENGKFKTPARCSCWGLVVMTRWNVPMTNSIYSNLCERFVSTCRAKGMDFEIVSMDLVARNVTRVDQLDFEFKKLIECAKTNGRELQLIFVSMPEEQAKEIHQEVKRLGDVELGIATQCIREQTIKKLDPNRPGRSVPTLLLQLSLKVNEKLGGVNCSIGENDPLWRWLTNNDEPTLFLGMDVSHPGVEERRNRSLPSLAAVTGNEDLQATKYGVSFKVQSPGQEKIMNCYDAIKKRLLAFRDKTGVRPSRLIIYRDGVSESQFRECLDQELSSIERAVRDLDGGPKYKPKTTFVIVQKGHSTKLYPKQSDDRYGTNGNVPVGTVVDKVITHPRNYDFYLASQDAFKGTARPPHYFVLWDDNNFDADTMHALTYRLCFLLQRCSKPVSNPALTSFAHLAAKRAMEVISAYESRSSSTESSSLSINEMQRILDQVKDRKMFFL